MNGNVVDRASVALFVVMLLSLATAAGDLTLVDQGKSDYSILVSRKPFGSVASAARELQTYLKRVTGAELPIVRDWKPGAKHIIVGEYPFTEHTGFLVRGLEPEGFVIETSGDNLLIIGRDTASGNLGTRRSAGEFGTFYAVHAFLEQFCGVRWFMPGDLGEVVPRMPTLKVPADLRIKQAPSFGRRRLSIGDHVSKSEKLALGKFGRMSEEEARRHGTFYRQQILWSRRNRLGGHIDAASGHAWYRIVPPKEYYARHPEYFALTHGCRNSQTRGSHSAQIDTSNPEVVALVAEYCKAQYRQRPDRAGCSISANDGLGYCECARCRSLDLPAPVKTKGAFYSDRLYTFYSAVAQEVAREFPGKRVDVYGYNVCSHAPANTQIAENLFIQMVKNGIHEYWVVPEQRQAALDYFQRYQDSGARKLGFYTYCTSTLSHFPAVTTRVFADLLPKLKELNLCYLGFYKVGGNWGARGLDNYVAARLMWDHTTDVQAMLDDYYGTFYGPEAGKHVRRYHGLIEDAYWRVGPLRGPKLRDIKELVRALYSGLRKDARAALDKALAASTDETFRKRVAVVSDNFRLTELFLDQVRLSRQIKSKPTREAVLAFRDATLAREAILDRNRVASLVVSQFSLRGREIGIRDMKSDPAYAQFLVDKYVNGKRFVIECPRAAQAPKLDGRLDDACWRNAEAKPFLNNRTGDPPDVPTTVSVCYDDRNVYVGFECSEPDMANARSTITKRDGPVWNEQEIEVFLLPDVKTRSGVQLLINSIGTQCDLLVRDGTSGEMSWNGAWTGKVTQREQAWTAEWAIPFGTIGTKPPRPGDRWLADFCRSRRLDVSEQSCFAPTFGLFCVPQFFGDLVFR